MKQTAIAVAICCAVFAAMSYGQSTTAEKKYVFAVSANGVIAWRMDTSNGQVSFCTTTGATGPQSCSQWLR